MKNANLMLGTDISRMAIITYMLLEAGKFCMVISIPNQKNLQVKKRCYNQ